MKYGVQYYPEQWPEERWSLDAEMMQRAGVNVVRMGEFAWGAYEPQEGQYNFSWMERAINLLGKHGIQTILCTCSRTPPPWVYHKYPSIASVDQDGRKIHTDARYAIGLAHPKFIELGQRIDEAVIRHFAGNKYVIAWQVDNEVGGRNDCYCDVCLRAFHAYLEDKYSTPTALNQAWGSNFWSFSFNEFNEVPVPGTQPQLVLEYRRFMSKLNVDFTHWRSQRIKNLDPGKLVTTNFQNLRTAHTDYHKLAAVIDVNGMNHYPSRTPELAIDYYRGSRGTVWAVEQHTRLQPVDTPEGWMRLWAWMTIAHGASGIVFFRWRQCRWGQEQYADGLLPHSGDENRFYADLSRMGAELRQIGAYIDKTKPRSQVAVIFSYESRWAAKAGRFSQAFDPVEEAIAYHKTLAQHVTAIDAMDPREDLSRYRLVIAPRLFIVDDAIVKNLRSYVQGGGTLCLTTGSGVADPYGKSWSEPRPGPFRDLAGITVSDLAFQEGMKLPLQSNTIQELNGKSGDSAADELHPITAEVVATHAKGWRKGRSAITINRVGDGRVIYIGTMLENNALDAVIGWLCNITDVERAIPTPEGVRIYERQSDNCRLLFLINWNEEVQYLPIDEGWRDAFTGEAVEKVSIAPNDIRILSRDV